MTAANSTDSQSPGHLKAVITASGQGIFAVGADDQFIGRSLRETGSYGLGEIALASQHISKEDEILVVGSHVGTLAIPLARICKHVTAIEANPWTYKLLQCNVILNDSTNVTTLNYAANDTRSSMKFVMNTTNSGGSKRFPKISHDIFFYDNPDTVDVQAVSLDEELPGKVFSLIIMDIEGSEYFALRGMPNILKNTKALFIEFLPHHLSLVAGITPEAFADELSPYFSHVLFPSTGERFEKADFSRILRDKFDRQEGHECVVFTK